MHSAFDAGRADLSGMDGHRGALSLEEIHHKATIAVDEQGSEASAATSVVVFLTSLHEKAEVHFDRPFLFFVEDRPTGQLLFVGHVEDPE